jgi:hypothetical protein
MKRLMTVVLVALLSLGVASLSLAQEDTPGMQPGSEAHPAARTHKKSAKKHSKRRSKKSNKKKEGSTGEEMK